MVRNMMKGRWQFPLALTLFHIRLTVIYSQGCSNTCPPINYGQPVESLCEGDLIHSFADTEKVYPVCHPTDVSGVPSSFALKDFEGDGRITVVANYYTGCNAGRRESGVFAHVAQRFYNEYGNRITFVQSVKGGGSCKNWSDLYQSDASSLYPDSDVVPNEMPLSVDDLNYEIRDDLFTTPFGHPSYVILDGNLEIKHKFIGPCCGFSGYYDCSADVAKELDTTLTNFINEIIEQTDLEVNPFPPTPAPVPISPAPTMASCQTSEFSEWSECSLKCGVSQGIEFRWRSVFPIDNDGQCPSPLETRACTPTEETCQDDTPSSCIQELGDSYTIETVASGFDNPRDIVFHPTPGLHLGEFSEGRKFYPDHGEEAWVVNAGNHSVSIVSSLGSEYQTTISRRDRGYYHYMINATAIDFNSVTGSGRSPDRDGFNYFAICNDDSNTYLGKKEPNFFMGPTLYNSDPKNRNLVNRLGEECREEEPCFFLHSDMLHEAPVCIGIAHDPETVTAYGNVYWAFDTTGNRQNGQLVRFDFQQPHGPGSMDHSVAAIRRYVEVKLNSGNGGHAGMVVHPTLRQIFVSVPGENKIILVDADSGSYARTAREEYPIYSNSLPSFEYSIWECVDQTVFAENIREPSGMTLSHDNERLFVAERATGEIFVYEAASGALLHKITTGFRSIGGLAISPISNMLYFVDEATNTLNMIQEQETCVSPMSSRLNTDFLSALESASDNYTDLSISTNGLVKDYQCKVNPVIPDASYFDQVHSDSGYASDNPDVQSVMAGMDASAVLLANRTDCGYDSPLNFDSLLLGGYFCHTCLPEREQTCDIGGECSNVQWLGYTCDNEFIVTIAGSAIELTTADGVIIDESEVILKRGVTYRFTVLENEEDLGLCVRIPVDDEISVSRRLYKTTSSSSSSSAPQYEVVCAMKGPLIIPVTNSFSSEVHLTIEDDENNYITFAVEDANTEGGKGLTDGVLLGIIFGGISVGLLICFIFIKRNQYKKTFESKECVLSNNVPDSEMSSSSGESFSKFQ